MRTFVSASLHFPWSEKVALSHFEWVRRSEDNETLGTIGFPGSAAPQCGISKDLTEDNRSEEQPLRR